MVHQTHDINAVNRILNHPKVYDRISDDSSPRPYYAPPEGVYIMDDRRSGVIALQQLNGIACQVHIAALPSMWGRARAFVKQALCWGFMNTQYIKVVALVPDFNLPATRLCHDCGFTIEGVLTKSFLKDWKMHNQTIYGITSAEFYSQRRGRA